MKSCLTIILTFLILNGASAELINCEEINIDTWNYVNEQVTCSMQNSTVISTPGYDITASKDDKIGALYFSSNKNIFYLPDGAYENFTNVVVLAASSCSLVAVYKSNFHNLRELIRLDLDENQIEEIASNTFEDLNSLQFLWLNRNKIKHLNGGAFTRLQNLHHVYLSENNCIDDDFLDPNALSTMPQVVAAKCGYCQSKDDFGNCEMLNQLKDFGNQNMKSIDASFEKVIQEQKQHGQIIEAFISKGNLELDDLKLKLAEKENEITEHLVTIARLEYEVMAAKHSKAQCDGQVATVQKIYQELETQRIENFYYKADEYCKMVDPNWQNDEELTENMRNEEAERRRNNH